MAWFGAIHKNHQYRLETQPRITDSIKRGLFDPPLITGMMEGGQVERDREGKVEMCPLSLGILVAVGGSSWAEREAEWTFKASQNDVGEQGHDGCADKARDGHGDKPGHKDVSEQSPVHCLPGAQPTDSHHRPDLKSNQKKRYTINNKL